MIYDKTILENIARLILARYCNYPIENLVCLDKPDLQDSINSYGIEVVEDCYSSEKEAERFLTSVWNMKYSEIDSKKIERLLKIGGELKEKGDKIFSTSLGKGTPNNPTHLIKTIKKKIIKLNNGGYKIFNNYGLYVYVNTVILQNSYVESIINEISKNQSELKYSKLYLDMHFQLWICDMNKKTYICKSIDRNSRNKIVSSITQNSR